MQIFRQTKNTKKKTINFNKKSSISVEMFKNMKRKSQTKIANLVSMHSLVPRFTRKGAFRAFIFFTRILSSTKLSSLIRASSNVYENQSGSYFQKKKKKNFLIYKNNYIHSSTILQIDQFEQVCCRQFLCSLKWTDLEHFFLSLLRVVEKPVFRQ